MAEETKAEYVARAKLSEQAERYDDMAESMRKVTESGIGKKTHLVIKMITLFFFQNWSMRNETCSRSPTRTSLVLADQAGESSAPSSRSANMARKNSYDRKNPFLVKKLTAILGHRPRIPTEGRDRAPRHLQGRAQPFGHPPYPQVFYRRVEGLLPQDEG